MRVLLYWFLCCASLALPRLVHAQVRTFEIDTAGSQAQFVSDAPLERITGVSTKVRGSIKVDPAHPESARGEVHVPVSSIRTNVELRDEHLRSDSWLDAARFPDATFVLESVSGGALADNQAVELKVNGKFSVHGVSHDVSTTARVRYTPGAAASSRDSLRVQASFVVRLDSYGVSIPSIVALKVAKDIRVNVDLRASAEKPAAVTSPVAEAPAPPALDPQPAPEKSAPKPELPARTGATEKLRKPAGKPQKPADEPVATHSAESKQERTPEPSKAAHAREPSKAAHAEEPSKTPPENPLASPPRTPAEAAAAVHALLRKAHYELVHGEATRALRFVQHAQKLMPEVEQGLSQSP